MTLRREAKRKIIIGLGNEQRSDDGIGHAFCDQINLPACEKLKIMNIFPELAEALKEYDLVVFADASVDGDEIELKRILPGESSLSLSHKITCEGILGLTDALYGKCPDAYLLSIKGYDFGYKEGLSKKAQNNLKQAIAFIEQIGGNFEHV